jgi:hypothetical protein
MGIVSDQGKPLVQRRNEVHADLINRTKGLKNNGNEMVNARDFDILSLHVAAASAA